MKLGPIADSPSRISSRIRLRCASVSNARFNASSDHVPPDSLAERVNTRLSVPMHPSVFERSADEYLVIFPSHSAGSAFSYELMQLLNARTSSGLSSW